MGGIIKKLRSLYNLWRLREHVRALPMPKLRHRDDADDADIERADAWARSLGGQHAMFAGDAPDGHPIRVIAEKIQRNMASMCDAWLILGNCSICGERFPGEWPPAQLKGFIGRGWIIRDWNTPNEGLVCPECANRTCNCGSCGTSPEGQE